MKCIGIVAEYNPLHNGHEYQIQKAREQFSANYVIVLMTGNFNQRGMPAIVSKEVRTQAAISAGADLIIEFPTSYALEDVPVFALCAVATLNHLGFIDSMLFSSESGNIDCLHEMSDIITSTTYLELFNKLASIKAPSERRKQVFEDMGYPQYAEIVNEPNNLLAIYFIAALKKLQSSIIPVTIKRIGDGYLNPLISDNPAQKTYSSATAIRNILEKTPYKNEQFPEKLSKAIPPYVYEALSDNFGKVFPITRDDFWPEIKNAVEKNSVEVLKKISGMNCEYADEMKACVKISYSYDEFVKRLEYKFEHVNFHRRIFRILTMQQKSDIDNFISNGPVISVQVLGYSSNGKNLLKLLDSPNGLNEHTTLAKKLKENTDYADILYHQILNRKFGGRY